MVSVAGTTKGLTVDWFYRKIFVPIWKQYKLPGFIVIAVLILAAAWFFGVDIGGYVNGLLGL